MKKLSFTTILTLFFAAFFGFYQAQAMTETEFSEKEKLYRTSKITPDEFYAACYEALSGNPSNLIEFWALDNLAATYALNKNFADAHKISNILIEKFPDQKSGYVNRGIAFLGEGNFAEARKDLRIAAQLTPEHIPTLGKIAMCYIFLIRVALLEDPLSTASVIEIFDENRISAEYLKGKELGIEGTISKIVLNPADNGRPKIILSSKLYPAPQIVCEFEPSMYYFPVKALKKGQKVRIAGNCTGLKDGNVLITNCFIITNF